MQNNGFYTNKTLNVGGKLIDLHTPRVMGILNITPDSFYDGGKFTGEDSMSRHVSEMVEAGADFIDVGGASSRPSAHLVPEEEERRRVLPAIRFLVKKFPGILISVDTFRASIAREAVGEGASMVNDISGGEQDPQLFETVASLQVPYVLMHMRGTPQTMSELTAYNDLIKELTDYFHQKIFQLHQAGVRDIILDPGFGFAKTREQNFELLHQLEHFRILGLPILAGLSRKSMIGKTLNIRPEDALNGTTVLNTIALMKSAAILRVHDVKEAVECIKLFLKTSGNSAPAEAFKTMH